MQGNKATRDEGDSHVRIEDMHFHRGERAIFNGISLDIPRGKITAIMGPSGTGKTTLLRLIGGQLIPSAGAIHFDGENIPELGRSALYRVRRKMGVLFQSGALFTDMSVYDNVAFPLRENTSLPEAVIRNIVLMKLEAVGLRGARNLMPAELSGGMSRRAALARAIALDPEIIMYDEPFAGQDPISMGVVVRLVKSLNETLGLTSVVVTHDVQEVSSIADYIYVFAGGKVIGQGTPEQMRADQTPRVSQFMQGLPDGPVPFHYPAPDFEQDLMGADSHE